MDFRYDGNGNERTHSGGEIIHLDLSEMKNFVSRLNAAAQGDFKKDLALFMEGVGEEFLRIVEDEIIRKKAVDTRLLLNSFQRGDAANVWVISEGGLKLEIGTNIEYAAYVNDGHWTCKAGEIGRFVPGVWNGDKFEYDPGAKTGMYLKQHWVEGHHFWESALRIIEKMYPDFLDEKFEEWLSKYFGDLM